MKKTLSFLLLCAVVLCVGGCGENRISTENAQFYPVEKTGRIPKEYSGGVIKKELLLKAAAVSDGYLLPGGEVEKYDLKGKLMWRVKYPFIKENGYAASVKIVPCLDSSFLLCADVSAYYTQDGTLRGNAPVLAKCDRDGKLLWQREYTGLGHETFGKVFCINNGHIITIGCANIGGAGPPKDIYLSLLDAKGNLINEKFYGGTDFEMFYDADYVEGAGLVALVSTQSKDGTFSASKDGSGEDVLLLLNDELNIKWQKPLGTLFSYDSMRVTGDAVYLLDLQNNYLKIDFNGNVIFKEPLYKKEARAHIVGNSGKGLLIQCDDELIFYNGKTEVLKINFNAGSAKRVTDTDGGFIIVSINITGLLPTPVYVSSLWFSTELVYSGYDGKGNLLWRSSFDNTPKAWKNYDPKSSPF